MYGSPVPVEIKTYELHDVFVALHVLRRLPQYTRSFLDGSDEFLYNMISYSVAAARWYFRREPKHGDFVRLLNNYLDALCRETKDSALDIAYIISLQSNGMRVPQLREPLSFLVVVCLSLGIFSSAAVALLIGIHRGCCDKVEIASLALSIFAMILMAALFPILYMSLKWSSFTVVERNIYGILDSFCKICRECRSCNNPFLEKATGGKGVADHSDAFLLDAETAHRHRKAIGSLLAEATQDDGNVVIQTRGLPPAAVNLRAIHRHVIIIMTDMDGRIVMWNEGAATSCGFSAWDAEGNSISSLLYGEKSVELYFTMIKAAEKNLDLSEKILTLAHMSLGSISISATVVVSRDIGTDLPIGYTLVGSVHSDELSQTQALFHCFYVAELSQPNMKEVQLRQIVECLRWNNLRHLSALSRGWGSTHVRRLLSEVIRGRQHHVAVEVDPKVAELPLILCDTLGVVTVLTRSFELFSGKIRVRVERKKITSAVYQLVVIYQHSTPEVNRELLTGIMESVNDLGGIIIESPGTLKLLLPFMVKDDAIQALRPAENESLKPTNHDPLIVLLLEKNAVHRHNISTAIWNYGHSLRQVESVQKALLAIEESNDIGCAIVDADVRGSDRAVEALLAKHIYTIETSEVLEAIETRGDALLKKPIFYGSLCKELDRAMEKCEEAKRVGEELMKRKEVFRKVRNSPWIQGRLLGRGAYASVYEATSTLTGGKMAVKMILVSRSFDDQIDEFMNEVEILCKLNHPNIIHYFYCERTQTTLNLFMALADQGTVADLLKRCPQLPENHVATIAKQLLQAVNYLHESGIIHRDIKPGNMLISQGQLKLSDFGTATTNVREGTVGTLNYMAPEVIDGKPSGKESDIWSIGCVVCECLQVRRAGAGGLLGYGAPEEYPSDISPEAVDFIKVCMHSNPSERATTGTLLLHDFIVHLEHEVSQLAEIPPKIVPGRFSEVQEKANKPNETSSSEISWPFH